MVVRHGSVEVVLHTFSTGHGELDSAELVAKRVVVLRLLGGCRPYGQKCAAGCERGKGRVASERHGK